jgi:hypothetical protein
MLRKLYFQLAEFKAEVARFPLIEFSLCSEQSGTSSDDAEL